MVSKAKVVNLSTNTKDVLVCSQLPCVGITQLTVVFINNYWGENNYYCMLMCLKYFHVYLYLKYSFQVLCSQMYWYVAKVRNSFAAWHFFSVLSVDHEPHIIGFVFFFNFKRCWWQRGDKFDHGLCLWWYMNMYIVKIYSNLSVALSCYFSLGWCLVLLFRWL